MNWIHLYLLLLVGFSSWVYIQIPLQIQKLQRAQKAAAKQSGKTSWDSDAFNQMYYEQRLAAIELKHKGERGPFKYERFRMLEEARDFDHSIGEDLFYSQYQVDPKYNFDYAQNADDLQQQIDTITASDLGIADQNFLVQKSTTSVTFGLSQ